MEIRWLMIITICRYGFTYLVVLLFVMIRSIINVIIIIINIIFSVVSLLA